MKLQRGKGLCSVPMWIMGYPAGFCDEEAYGEPSSVLSSDGLYVPGLACHGHGGPAKEKVLNLCSWCVHHFASCKSNPKFGRGIGNDNVYECDVFLDEIVAWKEALARLSDWLANSYEPGNDKWVIENVKSKYNELDQKIRQMENENA